MGKRENEADLSVLNDLKMTGMRRARERERDVLLLSSFNHHGIGKGRRFNRTLRAEPSCDW